MKGPLLCFAEAPIRQVLFMHLCKLRRYLGTLLVRLLHACCGWIDTGHARAKIDRMQMHNATCAPFEHTLSILISQHMLVKELHFVRSEPGDHTGVTQDSPAFRRQLPFCWFQGIGSVVPLLQDSYFIPL